MSSSEYTPPTSPICRLPESSSSSHFEISSSTSCLDQTDSSDVSSPGTPLAKRRKFTSKQLSRSTLRRRLLVDADSDSSFEEVIQAPQTTQAHNVCQETETNEFPRECIVAIVDTSSSSSSSSESLDGSGSESKSDKSEIGDKSTDSECSASSFISEYSSPGHECFNSSGNESDESDDNLLYEGSTVSTNQAILKVLKVFIAQRKTKTCLNADVKLTKSLLPEPNTFPSSAKALFKKLEQVCPFQKEISHFFCSSCKRRKTSQVEECICGQKSTSLFYEFSVEDQIRYMFENRDLASAIDSYHSHRVSKQGFISDIQDGSEYRAVRSSLKDKYDLVLMLNTDGVKLAKSSKTELWGLLAVICEVSPKRRLSYIIVCGVFVGQEKPDMNLFLEPFVKSMKLIASKNGISWTHPQSKNVHISMIVCPILCADAPAKAMVLKVKCFSHRYGCNTCEQKAVKVKVEENVATVDCATKRKKLKTARRFVYEEQPAALRNAARMNLQGELAEARGKSRKGVVGHAVVCGLPHFDRAKAVCAEYMHTVMLGVVKYFLSIFTSEKGPWNIGKDLNDINRFLKSIKVPDFIKRLPRSLADLPYLKASELRAFLLFYSLPALENYLQPKYFQHWLLLVAAIYLLLKDSISVDDLNASEIMLRCFVRDVSTLYHKKFYTYNVHTLLHLPLLVRRWGPLWS
ncbi:4'-phosphopantetheinyl transferase B, mitochondrial, partial [Frankliniella fusca]